MNADMNIHLGYPYFFPLISDMYSFSIHSHPIRIPSPILADMDMNFPYRAVYILYPHTYPRFGSGYEYGKLYI